MEAFTPIGRTGDGPLVSAGLMGFEGRQPGVDGVEAPAGDLRLRRRAEPVPGIDVFEVKLGGEFLMSSLFTVAEIALADLGLAAVKNDDVRLGVGGMGLGYSAVAAFAVSGVASLEAIGALPDVIDWHQRGLLPAFALLIGDIRTTLVHDVFFAAMRAASRLAPTIRSCWVSTARLGASSTPAMPTSIQKSVSRRC